MKVKNTLFNLNIKLQKINNIALKVVLLFLFIFSLYGNYSFAQVTGDFRSAGAGPANWSAAASWQRYSSTAVWEASGVGENNPGQVPGVGAANGNVTIQDAHTITLNITNATAIASLTVGQGASGILQFETATNRTITITGDLTINTGGQFVAQNAGVQNGNVIIGGNLSNSGTINFYRTPGRYADLVINGNTISGNNTYALRGLTLGGAAVIWSATSNINVYGSFTDNSTASFLASAGTFIFNRNANIGGASPSTTFNNLTIGANNATIITLNKAISVNLILLFNSTAALPALNNSVNNVTMANNSTIQISRAAGGALSADVAVSVGARYNVYYNGTVASFTTGNELPTADNLNNLSIGNNNAATVILNKNIIVNGTLTLNSTAATSFDLVTNARTCSMANNSTLTRMRGIINSQPTVAGLDRYNLTYNTTTLTTGNEVVPASIKDFNILANIVITLNNTIATLDLSGVLNMTNGTFAYSGTVPQTVNVAGNLTGITITMQGVALAHNLNLSGATNTCTTFNTTAGSGSTVNYNAPGIQTVFISANYRNLSISGSGIKTFGAGNITVNNDLSIANTCTFAYNAAAARTVTVTGNLSATNGTIDMSSGSLLHILNLGGITNNLGTLTTAAVASIINYNRAGDQSVFASANYRSLTTSGSGLKTIQGNITINNVFTVTASTFAYDAGAARTVSVTGNLSGTGVIDMSGGSLLHILNLGGTNNAITTFTTAAVASEVNYNAVGAQQVFASNNYRNLTISGGATKTLQGQVTVNNSLAISAGNLDPAGQNLIISGSTTIDGSFIDGNNAGANTFNGLVTVNGTGSFSTANSSAFTFTGGITNNGAFSKTGAGTVLFNASQTLTNNNGTMTIAGATTSSDALILAGANPITFSSSFSVSGAFNITNQNTNIITVTGNLDGNNAASVWLNDVNSTLNYLGASQPFITNGILTATANGNTVDYFLNGAQGVRGTTYYNLKISTGNVKTSQAAVIVTNDLTIGAGATLQIAGQDIDVQGGTSITGTLNDNALAGTNLFRGLVTLNGTGIWTTTNNPPFVFRNGIINNGTMTTTGTGIYTFNTNSQNLGGLNTITFQGSVLISGAINITNQNSTSVIITGTLDGDNAASTWINDVNSTLYYNNLTQPLNTNGIFTVNAVPNTVYYNLNGAQNVKATTYYNLIFANSGIKTCAGIVTVSNDFTVNGNGTDLYSNFLFTVNGLTNINANAATVVTFGGNTSTLALNNLNVTNTNIFELGSIAGQNKTITVSGTTTINVGSTWRVAALACTHVISLSGTISNSGTILFRNAAATQVGNLDLSSTADYSLGGTAITLNNLTFNAVGSSHTVSLGVTTNVYGNISIGNNNIFSLNGNTLTMLTNATTVTINNGGTLDINTNAHFQLSNTCIINNSGTLQALGTDAANKSYIEGRAAANYFTINQAAGTYLSYFTDYTYLGSAGITLSGGNLHATNNFSYCRFLSTQGGAGQILNLDNIDLTGLSDVTGIRFDGVSPTYNVKRTTGTGAINFIDPDAAGTLNGENYDNDNANPGTLVNWTYPSQTYYSQATGDFDDLNNWKNLALISPANVTDGLSSFVIQNGHTITIRTNGTNILSLQTGQGVSGALIIGNDGTARDLTIATDLTVKSGASVTVGAFNTSHTLNVAGNLTVENLGIFDLYTNSSQLCNITFNGPASQIIGPAIPEFAGFNIATNKYVKTNIGITIKETVTINIGSIFDDGGFTHNVAGNWTSSGTYTASGKIEFNGIVQNITTASSFYDITFKNGTISTIQNTLTANRNLLVSENSIVSVQSAAGNQSVKGNFTVSSGSFTQTSNIMYFDGAGAQGIDFTNSSFQCQIIFGTGGTKSLTGSPATAITGLVTVSPGVTIDGNPNLSMSANLLQNGTCNLANTATLTFTAGTIYDNNDNVFSLGQAAIVIAGAVTTQASPNNDAITMTGNLTIQSGSLTMNNGSSINGGAVLTIASGAYLYVTGDGTGGNFPSFTSYSFDPLSRVWYNAAVDQTIQGGATINYGSIRLSGAGINKTANGNINIQGGLLYDAAVTLNLGGNVLTIYDSYPGWRSINNNGGAPNIINGSLLLNAPDAIQTVDAGTYSFTNITISLDAPTTARTKTFSNGSAITVSGNVSITNGDALGSALLTLNLGTNLITGGNTFSLGQYCVLQTQATTGASSFLTTSNSFTNVTFNVNSTVQYSAGGAQDVADKYNAGASNIIYGNLTFSGGGNKNALGSLDIDGNITATGGIFIANGFDHAIAGNFAVPTANFTPGTNTIFLNGGNQNIVNATSFYNIDLSDNGSSGVKTQLANIIVQGNITINDNATLASALTRITLAGNWTCTGTGKFSFTNGTTWGDIIFNGLALQTIDCGVSLTNKLFGNFAVHNEVELRTLSDLDIDGSIYFTNWWLVNPATLFGIFNANGKTITVANDWYLYPGGTFNSNGSTVIFDSDGGASSYQYLYNQGTGAFDNMEFRNAAIKRFRYNTVDCNGNFSIFAPSTVDINFYGVNINVAGNWLNSGGTLNATNQTITFDGDQNNSISTESGFYHLSFQSPGPTVRTHSLTGPVTASGNLTINGFDIFDVGVAVNAVTVKGAWNNTTGSFIPRTGSVLFSGGTANINTGGAGAGKKFYDISVATTGTKTLTGNLDVDHDLSVSSGTFTTGANTINIGNTLTNAGIFNQSNNASIITFDCSTPGSINIDPGTNAGGQYRGMIFTPTAAITFSLLNNLTITNGQTITINNNATLKLGSKILSMTGGGAINAITINTGGTLWVDDNAQCLFANNNNLQNDGGTLKVVSSTSASPAVLGRNNTTGYTVTQTATAGGKCAFKYYIVQNTIGNGIIINNDNGIDDTYNFSNGTFTGGAGNSYIYADGVAITDHADNNLDTISNVVFNGSAAPTYNVYRNSGTFKLIFKDASGDRSGEIYDFDPSDPTLVDWKYPNGYFWTAGDLVDNTDWNLPANWNTNAVPDATSKVYLDHTFVAGTYTVNVKSADALAYRLITNGGAAPTPISLNLTNGYDLNIDESINIGNFSTLAGTDATNKIYIGGNWSQGASSTYTANSGEVIFDGPAGTYTITPIAATNFYDLTINAPGATYNLASNLNVANNLAITNGTLDVTTGSYTVDVKGNWTNDGSNGIFNPRTNPGTSTVTFSGITDQNITGGPFVNFTVSGNSNKNINTNITINGSLLINNPSIINAGTNVVYLTGNFTNNSTIGGFTQTGAGRIEFNGVNQTINGNNSNLNNIVLSGTGTKTLNIDINVAGDFSVNSSVGTVNLTTKQITGTAGYSFTLSGGTILQVRGASNFPDVFQFYSLASSSYVDYLADIDQNIDTKTGSLQYGNVRMGPGTNANNITNKTADGNLIVTGTGWGLAIGMYPNGTMSGTNTKLLLNNAGNSYNITLTGNLNVPAGSPNNIITWGTNSILRHVGTVGATTWTMDADLLAFNNLELAGSGQKLMQSNLTIAGYVTVESGVSLSTQTNTMTGPGNKAFTLSDNSTLNCAIPLTTGVAFPTNFSPYNLGVTSNVVLNSGTGIDQTIKGSNVIYGNITLSNVVKTAFIEAGTTLNVDGIINTQSATLNDNGRNMIFSGSNIYLLNYASTTVPVSTTITLDGGVQQIQCFSPGILNGNTLNIGNIVFSNAGTKTFGDGNDAITVNGNLTINNPATVTSATNITFLGTTWINNSTFSQTAGTTNFNGTAPQSINPGTINTFNNVSFDQAGIKTFSTNGITANGTFITIITSGQVDMGSGLSHTIKGSVTNNINANWITTNADFTFNGGGNQLINTPVFTARDITIGNANTKYMFCDWNIRNLIISGGTLYAQDNANSIGPFIINITGDWNNSGGTFTHRNNTVNFNGSTVIDPNVSITSNGSAFYYANFSPSTNVDYSIQGTTSIRRDMNIASTASLHTNGQILNLGANVGAVKTYTINGTLDINAGSTVAFDNTGGICNLTVTNPTGNLNIVGISGNAATITRLNTGGTNITVNGNISAQYYVIEYLATTGLNVTASATINATNYFQNGTWQNLAGAGRYLIIDASTSNLAGYPTTSIDNVMFNYTNPVIGTQYNIKRALVADGVINFTNPGGSMGDYRYEADDLGQSAPTGYNDGKITWPAISSVTWVGGTSTDWFLPANWSPATTPTNVITANIPAGTPNNPTIAAAGAVCKSLNITTGQLTISGANDLTIWDNVSISATGRIISLANAQITVKGSTWTSNTANTFLCGTSTVTFSSGAGSVTITPGTNAFYNLTLDNSITTFNITGTATNISNNFTITNGIANMTANPYRLYIRGNFNNSGTFTVAPGTNRGCVVFDGSVYQSITGGQFDRLFIGGSNTKETFGITSVNDSLTVKTGSTLQADGASTLDINGNMKMQGTFIDGGSSHTFAGTNWDGSGTYSGSGIVTFDGAAQNIITGSVFYNLIFAGTGIKLLAGNVTINNDLTLQNTITRLDLSTYTCNNSSGGISGSLTMGSTTLYVSGANNFPAGFLSYSLDPASIVQYRAATLDQSVYGDITYGNLWIQGFQTTKTLAGDIVIQGDLTFNTAFLDVNNANNYGITIAGNWYNNTGGKFISRQGEVIFNCQTANKIINCNATAGNKFYNLTINSGSAFFVWINRIDTVLNDLKVTTGQFNCNTYSTYIGNNLTALSGTFVNTGGGTPIYYLTKSSGTASIQTNNSTINGIEITGAATFILQDNLTVNQNLTVSTGTFDGNGKNVYLNIGSNTAKVKNTAIYKVGAGGSITMGNPSTFQVDAGGRVEVIGISGNMATVTRGAAGGRYYFNVDGTIAAQYYLFEWMQSSGIRINNTATIDPVYHLNDGTFTNCPAPGVALKIENTDDFSGVNKIMNVSFPTYPGAGAYNVEKQTTATGILEFYNSTGSYAGATYEHDRAEDVIHWTGPITKTWNGSVSTNWYTDANWTASSGPNTKPANDCTENVIIASVTNAPIIDGSGGSAYAANLTINNSATLTITTPDATVSDLVICGDLTINGTFTLTGSNDYIDVAGNWTMGVSAQFSYSGSNGGTVTFNGSGSTKNIDIRNSQFNNLVINATTSYQLARATIVKNDLTLNAGTLDISATLYDLTVKGNWLNTGGIFNARTGTVYLQAANGATKDINAGSSAFNTLYIWGGGSGTTYNLLTNDLTAATVNVYLGNLNLNSRTLNVNTSMQVQASSSVFVNSNAFLKLGNGASVVVNTSGTFKAIGSDASNLASVSRQSAGSYSFTVNSGAYFEAQYYLFEYMGTNGINLKQGSLVQTNNNLSNGTFSNGTATGRFLQLESDFNTGVNDLVLNIAFNSGPSYNITRQLAVTNPVTIKDATGTMGNYLYEQDEMAASDVAGALLWTYTNPLKTWTGSTDTRWDIATNWVPPGAPANTNTVYIPPVVNNPIIDNTSGNGIAHSLTIQAGGILTIKDSRTLTVEGDLIIANTGTLTVFTGTSANIYAYQWSNSGTFNPANSTVTLNALAGINSLAAGTTAGLAFCNLVIDGNSTQQLATSLDINGNLTINNIATLKVSNSANQIYLTGNWLCNGTFTHDNGTVNFDGTSGTQTITAGTGASKAFYNFIKNTAVAGFSAMTLASNIDIDNNFTINKGAVNVSNNLIYCSGDWTVSGTSTVSNANVYFDGTVTKSFTNATAITFTNFSINKTAGRSVLINNNFAISGLLTLTQGILNIQTKTFTLSGNIAAGGSGTISGSTSGVIIINGTGALSNTLKFTTGSESLKSFTLNRNGATVQLGSNLTMDGSGTTTLTDGAFDKNGFIYTLGSGHIISRAVGSLVSAPTFGATVHLTYTGTGAVNTGNEVPAAAGVLSNFTNSNTGGITLGSNVVCNGILTLSNSTTLSLSNRTLTINGTISGAGSGTLIGSATSNLIINGAGVLGNNLNFVTTLQLNNLTVNRNTGATLGTNLTVEGTLSIPAGLINLNGKTLTINGTISGAGTISGSNTSNIIIGGSGAFGSLVFTGGAQSLNNLTINRNTAGTVNLASNLTLFGTTTLTDGVLTINPTYMFTLNSGATIIRDIGTITPAARITFPANVNITYNGTTDITSAEELPATVQNFTINRGTGKVTLASNLTINGILNLTNGFILTSTRTLSLASAATINPASGSSTSFIDGKLKKTGNGAAYTFPVGDFQGAVKYFAPVDIAGWDATNDFTASYTHVSAFDSLTIITWQNGSNLAAGLNNASGKEFWLIDRTGAGAQTPNVTLNWLDADASDIAHTGAVYDDLTDLTVVHWNTGTSKWDDMGGSAAGVYPAGSITGSGFTSYSPVTFGSKTGINPLPVSLINFVASCENGFVNCQWSTLSEMNNDYFDLQKSSDLERWEYVATIKGAGNSNKLLNYNYIDKVSDKGTIYYKLIQHDFDGNKTSYNAVSANCTSTEDFLNIIVYPNPASNVINLITSSSVEDNGHIYIYNDIGNCLYSNEIIISPETNKISVDITKLGIGNYYVKLVFNKLNPSTHKFVHIGR